MGLKLIYGSGQTPIDEEEKEDIIPFWITNNEQLNRSEQENINKALKFFSSKTVPIETVFTLSFIKKVHKKMFGDVWRWAGEFRTTDKNIGVSNTHILPSVYILLGDVAYWVENNTFSVDEIAIRCKHRMVSIHPFPNGNGRHSRVLADILVKSLGGEIFTWGAFIKEARDRYLRSLRKADNKDYRELLLFARS